MVDPITVGEIEFELHKGQTLLLFTDGVPEAARSQSGPAFALERLSAKLRKRPLEDMLKHIEAAAVQSAGGQPHDDIALLGLRLGRARGGLESIEQ
jgi:serine phosphatase RsbU (regulator of sigma subunit)